MSTYRSLNVVYLETSKLRAKSLPVIQGEMRACNNRIANTKNVGATKELIWNTEKKNRSGPNSYKILRFFLIEENATIVVVNIPLQCSLNQCATKRKDNLLLDEWSTIQEIMGQVDV